MADLVGGAWGGVAKNAQIISVKIGSGQSSGEPINTKGEVASAWAAVIHDVVANNRQGKAVISFSNSTTLSTSYYLFQ
jgi:hypothetical protein